MIASEYTTLCTQDETRRGFVALYPHVKQVAVDGDYRTMLIMSADEVEEWFAYESYCALKKLVYRHAGPASRDNESYIYEKRFRVLDEFTYSLMPLSDKELFCALLPEMPYVRGEMLPGQKVLYGKSGEIREDATNDMKAADRAVRLVLDTVEIWREASLRAGRRFITSSEVFGDGMWDEIRGFGDEIGVEPMLAAYFSGVPLHDIVE